MNVYQICSLVVALYLSWLMVLFVVRYGIILALTKRVQPTASVYLLTCVWIASIIAFLVVTFGFKF